MQSVKSFKLQNYTRCKMKQSAKLCKMQNYNKYKIMQGANYAILCKIMHKYAYTW